MQTEDDRNTPARVRAALVDPGTMKVLWTNASSSQVVSDPGGDDTRGVSIDDAVPMADTLGVPEALRAVASTGIAQHLRADLVSTGKGSMVMVVSIHRLPDGNVLMLTENTWQAAHKTTDGAASRRSGRRAR